MNGKRNVVPITREFTKPMNQEEMIKLNRDIGREPCKERYCIQYLERF